MEVHTYFQSDWCVCVETWPGIAVALFSWLKLTLTTLDCCYTSIQNFLQLLSRYIQLSRTANAFETSSTHDKVSFWNKISFQKQTVPKLFTQTTMPQGQSVPEALQWTIVWLRTVMTSQDITMSTNVSKLKVCEILAGFNATGSMFQSAKDMGLLEMIAFRYAPNLIPFH